MKILILILSLLFLSQLALSQDKTLDESLIEAIEAVNFEEIQNLIDQGADINIQDELGNTYLHYATRNDQVVSAKLAVKYGADINIQNNKGQTPLHVTTSLLFADPSSSEFNYSLTSLLFDSKNTKVVKFLIKSGTDINIQDSDGQTFLHLVAHKGNAKVTKLVVKNDETNINIKDNKGWTALHTAVIFGKAKDAKLLVKYGVDLNIRDNLGRTALHLAIYKGDTELMNFLLKSGSDINAQTYDGRTPLDTAIISKNSKESVKFLKRHNALTGKELREVTSSNKNEKLKSNNSKTKKIKTNKNNKLKSKKSKPKKLRKSQRFCKQIFKDSA